MQEAQCAMAANDSFNDRDEEFKNTLSSQKKMLSINK